MATRSRFRLKRSIVANNNDVSSYLTLTLMEITLMNSGSNRMSDHSITENPFSALFPSAVEAESFSKSAVVKNNDNAKSESFEVPDSLDKPYLIEDVLLVTVNPSQEDRTSALVFLEDLSSALKGQTHIANEYLNQALFERLMLEDPDSYIVKPSDVNHNSAHFSELCEKRILFYLYQSFHRLWNLSLKDDSSAIKSSIIEQSCTFLCHPDVFPPERSQEQLIDLLRAYHGKSGHSDTLSRFLVTIAECIVAQNKIGSDDVTLTIALSPSLETLRQRVLKLSLVNTELFESIDILHYFTHSFLLSEALLEFSTPQNTADGKAYQDTLLGAFLSASCLPRNSNEPFTFFENPAHIMPQDHAITEANLWVPLSSLALEFHKIFHIILKQSPRPKDKLLSWIGKCIRANSGRSKLWNSQLSGLLNMEMASDAFMLNLEAVLLQLCKPFVDPLSPKILRVNPSYCCVKSDSESVHLPGLSEETFLISREERSEDVFGTNSTSYNFLTEVFFLTHFALKSGFKVVHEQLFKLSQELGRIQRLYEESRVQGGEASEIVQSIKTRMEKGMTRFLSIKAAVLEPQNLETMFSFHIATAAWLTQIATNSRLSNIEDITFPLSPDVPSLLYCVPEFIIENVADFVIFLKHFNSKTLALHHSLEHLMTMILVFMGSPERMKNPHLRANLAEMLEAVIPPQDADRTNTLFVSANQDVLFTEHQHITNLVPTLLHVFVSIEMTGQSVAFEQKFQYRRPMYIVLNFLWTIDIHRQKMKELAVQAEKEIESVTPPLFLKFINLLMNDAIFLLDEALSSMSQLREHQLQRNEWGSLPIPQRHQREANFQHMGLLARFYNVMGNDTIHTLEWLTSEIQSIFCHPTIVDRMAAMLNYFLYHLVGPKKKNLKVKDLGEYEFKPQELVRDICRIYLHLGNRKSPTSRAFCSAVSKDGRSYSPELFTLADEVLYKIVQPQMASELEKLATYVNDLATEYEKEEEALADAPEEFLDPIMNTIMLDPVRLPSSGINIDRATISRHLLSDQTDPFNRSPLTMDMVVANDELRTRIKNWIEQNKRT